MAASESAVDAARRAPMILCAVALSATAGWLEHGLRAVDDPSTQKRRGIERRLDRLDVLVAGTSMALTGVDPSVFGPNAFNAGIPGQSLHQAAGFILEYLPKLTKLRAVVFTLSLPAFEYDMGTSDPRAELPLDLKACSAIVRLPADARFQYVFRPLFHFHDMWSRQADDNGWLRWEGGGVAQGDTAKATSQLHQTMRPENIPENEHALANVIDAITARGVRLALVVMPVHVSYIAQIGDESRARFYAALKRVAARRAIPVHDYHDDPRMQDGDFRDPDHLNTRGATRFSRILANDLGDLGGGASP